jgi:hypothetical protein
VTFNEFKNALQALSVSAHISHRDGKFVVSLVRTDDHTTIVVAHEDVERAVEFAIARFIEVRRKNPTAPLVIEYPTPSVDLTNPWVKT